jgi:hypothetical protein
MWRGSPPLARPHGDRHRLPAAAPGALVMSMAESEQIDPSISTE